MHQYKADEDPFTAVISSIKEAAQEELQEFVDSTQISPGEGVDLDDEDSIASAYERLAVGVARCLLDPPSEEKQADYSGFGEAVTSIPLIDVNTLRGVIYDPMTRGLNRAERDIMSSTLSAAQATPSPMAAPGYASPYQFGNLAVGMGTPSRKGQLVGLGLGAIANLDNRDKRKLQVTGLAGEILKSLVSGIF